MIEDLRKHVILHYIGTHNITLLVVSRIPESIFSVFHCPDLVILIIFYTVLFNTYIFHPYCFKVEKPALQLYI